jgi:hypothetical protein
MKNVLRHVPLVVVGLCLIGRVAFAQEADKGQASALNATVLSYLDRMKTEKKLETYEADTGQQYPVYTVPYKMANATHHLKIVVDPERKLVYFFLNRYLIVPPRSPNLAKVLEALMEQNWELNVGKFEWDKTDGEIRFSMVHNTEDGLGLSTFEVIITTLLETGDKLWPKLRDLAETGR